MDNPRHVTIRELNDGIARWTPLIIDALSSHKMTADDLVSHLLAENYDNIDKESDLIIETLNSLIRLNTIRVSIITHDTRNGKNKVETYLTCR